jgi:hypothetical protein
MYIKDIEIKTLLKNLAGLFFVCLVVQLWVSPALGEPAPAESSTRIATDSGQSNGGGGESALPDLFTGAMSYQVPIEVPPGRNGLQPSLALMYRSNNGNGWVGMGWQLEVGAIERSTRKGVDYTKDNFVFRRAGGISELVSVGNGGFRSKIESDFTNIQRHPDGFFIAIDKVGTKYFYGQTANSRIDGLPGTFKWSLDRVEDTSGNFITYTYQNNGNGQIYLDHIDYNGNQIKFYLEGRNDFMELYTANFMIKTTKRLKFIHVISADGTYTRSYKLDYVNSNATNRSNLSSVQQFGTGATLDAAGNIMNEGALNKLPAQTFSISPHGAGFEDQKWADSAIWQRNGYNGNLGPNYANTVAVGDFNGDGRSDVMTTYYSRIFMKESKLDQNGKGYFDQKEWPISWPHYLVPCPATYCDEITYGLGPVGYFTDDARMDMLFDNRVNVSKAHANGNGYFDYQLWSSSITLGSAGYRWVGDFDGDGRMDFVAAIGKSFHMAFSKPNSTNGYL